LARLIHPTAGTVVTVEGDLESQYRAAGWFEESDQQEQAPSEKPDESEAVPEKETAAPSRARRSRKA
jgi:hypothetical protein